MRVILDTNIVSLLQRKTQPATDRILAKLRSIPVADQWTTVVTFQEQTQGWLAAIQSAKSDPQLLRGYQSLQEMLDSFRKLNVFPFDTAALAIFRELKVQRLGVGTHDLRIASIALARGAVVVTQNRRDFARVPGLLVDDWTA